MDRETAGPAEPRFHALAAEEALAALGATAAGLSGDEAARRLAQHGPNRLPEAPRRGILARLLAQANNILIYVLLASGVIAGALGHGIDAAVIFAVVLVNAVIGMIQEGRAERAMEAIRKMLAPRASVLRDGRRASIDGAGLVPGDIVLIEAGDRIPADLRLLAASRLQLQEAILTGESVPVEKQTLPVDAAAPLGDRASMAFSGTLVSTGLGRGVVVATGARSEIGRISGLIAGVETLTTPLVRQMDEFARWLTFLILAVAAALLVYGWAIAHQDFAGLFMAVVSLSVAAIPESLPAVLTITLAIGVQAMARRHAIVRRLPAIETLGAVSVICTDKTGTLTRNEMMAAAVAAGGAVYELSGEGYAPDGMVTLGGLAIEPEGVPALRELAIAAALCNEAALVRREGAWAVEGDPMEGALLALAGKLGFEVGSEATDHGWRRVDTLPFDARHRYMATLSRDPEGAGVIFAKGAPERIIHMCHAARAEDGTRVALDAGAWHARAEELADKGQRVLALATGAAPGSGNVADGLGDGLVLIGLVGLIDPPRPEAIAAVADCAAAGIRVKMITGDHAGTAGAIGRQIGLQNAENVLTGSDLDEMDEAELEAAVLGTDIFARTNPEHKLRLVMALQAHGLTVAMTGDGVNDAPALKRADAGIAMGLKGSEAAKEAAEIVLADDNFASIAAAVREGRTVYDNIKKVISWTLPTSAGEAMTVIAALLLGATLPVTPIQILWVNLVTAVTLGLALAFEPTEGSTMHRPPRARGEAILSGGLAWHIVLVSTLFLAGVYGIFTYALDRGYPVELARTMALNTLVVMEIFHLFFIRNIYGTSLTWAAVRGTPVIWLTVVTVTLAQFAITYLPPMQAVFATAPVPLMDGLVIVGIGVALFGFVEIEKQFRLSIGRGRF